MPPRLAFVLGLLLALLAPAAAQAATFTVDPADGSPCSASDTTCPTIASAVSAAKGGDTVHILKGTYGEAVDVATGKDGLTIEGTGLGEVKISGSGTGDVVTIASKDVTLKGVTVDVPGNGKSAVAANATGAKLVAVVLQRSNASTENVAVVSVPDAGTASLEGAFVIQNAGAAGTPAIRSTGAGLSLADTVVVSSTGPAVQIEGGEQNLIARSTLAATEPASDAVRVLSNDAGKRSLTTDSTVVIGGAKAAGILAKSSTNAAGDIALAVRHATIAGSVKGIVLDASEANGPGLPTPTAVGNIDAKVFSSIVHGNSSAARHAPPLPLVTTANTATLTFANSDAPPPGEGNGTVEMGGASNTEDAKLFIPKSLKLRPDAPLIDKGGALQAGESSRDFENDAREVDGPDADGTPQSDIGADEYVNGTPKAIFGITNKNPRQNEAIGFVSGSTDPELAYGGTIVEYRWDFGDGHKETTAAGGVAHTYTQTGTFQATLQVVDSAGAVSPVSAPQEVVVKDGIAPEVTITNPVEGQTLNLKSTYLLGRKRPKPRQLTVLGKVADASGVASVEVALYVVKRDKVKRAPKKKKRKRRARASQTAPKLCEFYSGNLFAKKDCTKEIWLKASLIPGGTWAISTKKGLRLPAGRYQMRVRATDGTGLLSSEFSTKAKTLVNFRVR
jgi:hypothetical protein